ncbi:MAG: glutamate racemase [Thermodesulfobacteriota bacterium]|nr:MAG: glutamate racemase [Thermodesulfobacteriota bacterium]
MKNDTKNAPIGVFDSGIGGLTVAKELIKTLPGEDIIYLGDTARVPYGTKSGRTVIAYSRSNTEFLISKGIKLLVVACNTASSVSIPSLKAEFDIPVLGVIEPGAKKAVEVTHKNKIGVIGTPSTINSGAYTKAIENLNPDIEVISKPCPLFVPLADEGWVEGEIVERVAEEYLNPIKNSGIDVLVLGCTHYPLLKNTIQKIVGEEITLVDSAQETASQIKQILVNKDLLNDSKTSSERNFYLTDVSDTFISVAGRFLGEKIDKIEMVDIVGTTAQPSL